MTSTTALTAPLTIPTPADVVFYQASNLANTARGLRVRLIAALMSGKTTLDGMYSDMIVDLVRDEFTEAGWIIDNEGLSLSLRRVKPITRIDLDPEPGADT